MTATVYLKCRRNIVTQVEDVFVADVASVRCQDKQVAAKVSSVKVHHFRRERPRRCVISVLHIIKCMEECCPDISVEVIGESDVLLEWVDVPRNPWKERLKVVMVCLICFFGTGFTIMAYHNDSGINTLFGSVYQAVMNVPPRGVTIMEISYSIGLALGIIVFFNHVGTKRITKDPTPIEVAMRIYEEDVDRSIVDTAERAGWEIEAENLGDTPQSRQQNNFRGDLSGKKGKRNTDYKRGVYEKEK